MEQLVQMESNARTQVVLTTHINTNKSVCETVNQGASVFCLLLKWKEQTKQSL